jgi:hypothetical protein
VVIELAASSAYVRLNLLVAEAQQLFPFLRRQLLHIGDQAVTRAFTLHEPMLRQHPPGHVLGDFDVILDLALVVRQKDGGDVPQRCGTTFSISVLSISGW